MRKGEKYILGGIVALSVVMVASRSWQVATNQEEDLGIPYYTTASNETRDAAAKLMRELNCRECHSLWALKDVTQNVPAPALDGIGSLRDEEWFYRYLSAANPQEILPTRLKEHYKMPSYSHLEESQRRLLSSYLGSLKVKAWYLEATKKAEYEKLTGKPYQP